MSPNYEYENNFTNELNKIEKELADMRIRLEAMKKKATMDKIIAQLKTYGPTYTIKIDYDIIKGTHIASLYDKTEKEVMRLFDIKIRLGTIDDCPTLSLISSIYEVRFQFSSGFSSDRWVWMNINLKEEQDDVQL